MKGAARTNIRILGKRKGEKREVIAGAAGVVLCPKCRAVYFKKAWRASAERFLGTGKKPAKVSFKLCPACTMIKEGLYEGVVTIKDVPVNLRTDVIGLIKNFCKKAEEKDPMDRLIAVKSGKNALTLTTTENQLAHKLAKHITKSFKGARALTLYGKNDNVTARIEITFPKKI